MKKVFAIFLTIGFVFLQAQPTRILWIGNSYTTVNNLPLLFHDLALSAGDTVIYDSNAPGGYTFQQHSANATTIQKIYSQPWDYVVLQAQSQESSFPPSQVEAQTYPYAQILDSLIRDNDSCTETIFYMTWGKKYGDQQNCGGYPILCNFDGVQSRLTDSYVQMANDNRALVAPAGRAWQTSWHTDTLINLWAADNSHPSVAGSYLTACVFYGTIFGKSPVGIVYSPISAHTTNDYLQNIAYHTVFDSLTNWNIGAFDVMAEFDFTGNEATRAFSFNNFSQNSTAYEWNFGDGNTSSTSGEHTYAGTGTYTITLVAFDNCGRSDTTSQILTINGANTIENTEVSKLLISPNPANSDFTISNIPLTELNNPLVITDIDGRVIIDMEILSDKVSVLASNWASGVYFLKLSDKTHLLVKL